MRLLRSIAAELGLVLLLVALVPLVSVFLVVNGIFSQAIEEEKKSELFAIADAAHGRIESYIKGLLTDATTLAKTPGLTDLLERPEAELTPSPALLEFFRTYRQDKGFYDLMLVDRLGRVRFSLQREADLGQSLDGDMLKPTQLPRAVDAANTLLQTEISNFAYYPPSQAYAAFLAAPVFEAGMVMGNVVLQIDNRELNRIVNQYGGLGRSGEVLAGTMDGSQLIITAPARNDPELPGRKADALQFAPLLRALTGQQGSGTYDDYRGHETLAVWRYVPSLNWGMLVKIDTEELYAPIAHFKRISLGLMLGAGVLVLLGILLSDRLVTRPIVRFARKVKTLSTEALPQSIEVVARHEIGDLVTAFNGLVASVRSHHGELESRVASRTAELAGANVALDQARQEAEGASRSKSQFLANMSHEIRTPMNAILGMLKLAQSTELTPRQYDYITKSEGAAKALLGLINDILDFSKIDAGKLELDPHLFRVDRLMRDLAVVLSANAHQKAIEILFDIDPDLPEVLMGDAMRLQQVLINLGGNAVKFTAQGQVVVALKSVQTADAPPGTAAIQFSVEDSGIGIAPEHSERIFSGFTQAEGSTTRNYGGTGLGLAISKRLVDAMGGTLDLSSTVGRGTRFFFTLHLPVVTDVPAELAQAERAVPSQYRVLVVDDNPIACELMQRMTRNWSTQCDVATSGEQALALVRQNYVDHQPPYEVVYLDCQMPGIDGWETARRLRTLVQQAGEAKPMVIMVTGNGREVLNARTHEEQDMLDGFLVKPVTASMLLDAVLDARTATPRVRQVNRSGAIKRSLVGMRILVVEDNLINQQVAEELLAAQGAFVALAANGRLGVDAVAAASPQFDVVLMDVQMPVMDGYDATREIRHGLGLTDLPIIGLTANAMASDRAACLEAGMTEHVGKPFDLSQLISLLIRLTGHTPPAQELSAPAGRSAKRVPDFESDHLDLATALGRMGGLESLYLRAAKELDQSLTTLVSELGALVREGDFRQSTMLLHTFKGTTATLGLTSLAATLGRMEHACANNAPIRWHDEMQVLQEAVEAAREALAAASALLMQPDPHAPPALPSGSAAQAPQGSAAVALAELLALLEHSDMEALQTFAGHRDTLAHLPEPQIAALEDALQNLDFDSALAVCRELAAR